MSNLEHLATPNHWYGPNIIFTQQLFNKEQIADIKYLVENMYGFANSKFKPKGFNVLNEAASPEDHESIVVLVFTDSNKIHFKENQANISTSFGDAIAFKNIFSYEIRDNTPVIRLTFKTTKDKKVFGSGKDEYVVTAHIRDQYTINVFANSESEAIDIANNIPVDEWEHPDIDPELHQRQLVRYAKWGNLDAKKL